MKIKQSTLPRREFLKKGAGTLATVAAAGTINTYAAGQVRVPLGLDAHSVRGMRWKAAHLIDYAAEINADALLLNGPQYFTSLEEAHLKKLKEKADAKGIRMYTGAGGISKNSVTYKDTYGTPEQTLALGIRIAKTLGSPVVNCRIGMINDRFTDGGIEARMEEAIQVLKASRSRAEDAGIKFGFENHAGDMRSEEILTIIHEVGEDICGSMLDPGNSLWALEDPMKQIQILGKHVLCTSVRDYMIWESEGGATFQWTAIGEGLMDAPAFVKHMATLCPGVPLFVESISNSARPIPFLTEEHMASYPKLRAAGLVDFLKLLRRGRPLKIAKPPAGMKQSEFDQQHQKAELLRSFEYLRHHCNVGLKSHRH